MRECIVKEGTWPYEKANRNLRIYEKRRSGMTYTALAKEFRLTPERIRQICRKVEYKGFHEAQEIVRCRDCAYFENDHDHGARCKLLNHGLWDDHDGFCAWGSRREA